MGTAGMSGSAAALFSSNLSNGCGKNGLWGQLNGSSRTCAGSARHGLPWRTKRGPRMLCVCQVSQIVREAAARQLLDWLEQQGLPEQAVTIKEFGDEGLGCAAAVPLKPGDVALKVPEKLTVTAVDVVRHPVIGSIAAGREDLIGLTLWYMYESSQGDKSWWHPYLLSFPQSTLSPLLWTLEEQNKLLAGSPVLAEVRLRVNALEGMYEEFRGVLENDRKTFPEANFSLEAFKAAFAIVLSRAIYLPTPDTLALVPFADVVNHRSDRMACIDFSWQEQSVVLKVDGSSYKVGEQVFVSYGQNRPNSDLLISYGFVEEANPQDHVELEVGLVAGDGLRQLKQQIVEAAGLGSPQRFPLFADRFPSQLLSYMRLVRLQDPGLFAKISFDKDVIVDEANEYEVLMLLMSECRSKLGGYERSVDEETRLLKGNLTPKEKVAAKLRLCEQKMYVNTLGALRNRLAPIRGIPTKGGGLKDPNSDIREMFDMVEQLASAPAKLFSKIFQSNGRTKM